MTKFTVKELVSGNTVQFLHYRKGHMYYEVVEYPEFVFPVPVEDIGDATFNARDKALLFMRYIRKHLDNLSQA